jgi:hypothetical protein
VLSLDEFETLSREKAYLESALAVPVEIYSADKAREDPKGKSKQAEPGRPGYILNNLYVSIEMSKRLISLN